MAAMRSYGDDVFTIVSNVTYRTLSYICCVALFLGDVNLSCGGEYVFDDLSR